MSRLKVVASLPRGSVLVFKFLVLWALLNGVIVKGMFQMGVPFLTCCDSGKANGNVIVTDEHSSVDEDHLRVLQHVHKKIKVDVYRLYSLESVIVFINHM